MIVFILFRKSLLTINLDAVCTRCHVTTVDHEARMPSIKSNSNHQFNGKNVFVEFAMAQGNIKLNNNDCFDNKNTTK